MSDHMARAAAAVAATVRDIKPDQLSAPTPCAEFDVRKVVHHLLFWGPSLEAAAHKESVPPPAAAESDVDLTTGDWAADLTALLERVAQAWARPSAWEGTTRMGGPIEFPAAVIGGMLVGELVVHGWDLARATGNPVELDDDLLAYLHPEVAAGAEQGRQMGFYGPEVAVPVDAPTLDRILGLTGRDPAWTPLSAGAAAPGAAG